MTRTVVIFGAGASQPFFEPALTTSSLTQVVMNWSRWSRILARYSRVAKGANSIHPPAVRLLLEHIPTLTDAPTFEDIADIMDKVGSYHFDHTHRKSLHAAMLCLGAHRLDYPTHAWTLVPFLLRQLIAEDVQAAHEHRRPEDGAAGDVTMRRNLRPSPDHGIMVDAAVVINGGTLFHPGVRGNQDKGTDDCAFAELRTLGHDRGGVHESAKSSTALLDRLRHGPTVSWVSHRAQE